MMGLPFFVFMMEMIMIDAALKRNPLSLKCIIAFSLVLFFYSFPCHAMMARVEKISDGDTVSALTDNGDRLKIRLFGIDAPERSQPHGKESRTALSRMIGKKEIDLEIVAEDKYGRCVAVIRLGNRIINKEMVERGHAWVYRSFCRKSYCSDWIRLEEEAREKEKGLWKESDPVAPWDYRREKKGKGSENDFLDLIESCLKKMLK